VPVLPRIGIWSKVPDGSRLLISVTGTDETHLVTGHVSVLRDDGNEMTFPDSAVQPGPLVIGLDPGHSFSVFVDLVYTTAATATVSALVLAPVDTVFPQKGAPPAEFSSVIPGAINFSSGVSFFIEP
jgi:hypothetical protein